MNHLVIFILLGLVSCSEPFAPESANVITFHENTLFVADSMTAAVHAYDKIADDTFQEGFGSYNVQDLEFEIADLLGTTVRKIVIKDLAIHPLTQAAYIAVHRMQDDYYTPVVVVAVNRAKLRIFDLRTPHTFHKFGDAINEDFKFWRRSPARQLTFTDIKYFEGKVYAAGLSNGDFKSTLRIVDYPFTGEDTVTHVEIYHANHDQTETRAPIRTMEIVSIEGTNYLVAAYTCTPLVVFKLEEVLKGGRLTGMTIGEVGFGNTPIDLISFVANDQEQNAFHVLLMNNKHQSPQIIQFNDMEQSIAEGGLKTPAGFKAAGVPTRSVPMNNLLHIDNQDEMRIAAIRRDPDTGYVELITFLKNIYFRISDYQSEFEFPDYSYPSTKNMGFLQGVHKMLRNEEGFLQKPSSKTGM